MPLHDWTKVEAGIFHHFHQAWAARLCERLNSGGLPEGYVALIEQRVKGPEPDLLTVATPVPQHGGKGNATRQAPVAQVIQRAWCDPAIHARRAHRVTIHHPIGDIIAIIEIISPGNKASRMAVKAFVGKVKAFLRKGVHVLLVDLFPPTRLDPCGLHGRIWQSMGEDPVNPPDREARAFTSYGVAEDGVTAYINYGHVGAELPEMPLFLKSDWHVKTPLGDVYETTWNAQPAAYREYVLERIEKATLGAVEPRTNP